MTVHYTHPWAALAVFAVGVVMLTPEYLHNRAYLAYRARFNATVRAYIEWTQDPTLCARPQFEEPPARGRWRIWAWSFGLPVAVYGAMGVIGSLVVFVRT